jgi:hypothetical protein
LPRRHWKASPTAIAAAVTVAIVAGAESLGPSEL